MSTDSDIPMPAGNGDKDCLKCRGRGVVPMEIDGWPGGGTQNCICVFRRDLTANVKRIWPVLLTVDSVESSPLLPLANRSLWLTASNYTLRRHMRYVAFRMGTTWDARVIADSTLMTAWLSTAKHVRDPDVLVEREDNRRDTPSDHFQTLVDLAVPFDLLIIRLGVKSAANKEMANVLAEAVHERELLGKPTWVSDSPGHPLGPGHLSYSDEVMELLDGFKRVTLKEEASAVVNPVAPYKAKAVTQTALNAPLVAAPIPAKRVAAASPGRLPAAQTPPNPYAPKKVTYQDMSMAPSAPVTKRTIPLVADDDEFSVDSLAANAHTPDLHQREADPEVEETESEEDYPLTFEDVVGKADPIDVPLTGFLAAAARRKGST